MIIKIFYFYTIHNIIELLNQLVDQLQPFFQGDIYGEQRKEHCRNYKGGSLESANKSNFIN